MSDTLIITLLAFIGSMVPIITVILRVNGTLTKLNMTIDILTKQMIKSENDRENIHKQLNDHETRIVILEKKE